MPSIPDLANDALSQIGQNPITALDDGSTASNLINRFYATVRDAVLRDHTWGFASKRVELAETTTPVFDWNYAFTLPADNLRIVRMGTSDGIQWQIEGKTLVTQQATASVLYIFREENLNNWDTLAFQALATRLASKLAVPLASDKKLMGDLYSLYRELVLDAESVDGQESIGGIFPSTALTTDVRQ